MLLPQYDLTGNKTGQLEVSDTVFGVSENPELLHQAMVFYAANQRQGTSNTLTRGAVHGTTRKPFAQKGTGRARQGSWRSPHHRGGGVAFGPSPRSYRKRMPKQMRRQAIRVALSGKVSSERLFVIEGLDTIEQKTKAMSDALTGLGVSGSVLVVTGQSSNANRTVRNLPRVKAVSAELVNVLDLLRFQSVLVSPEAVKAVDTLWSDLRRVRKEAAA
ncbi:MAG: 50S ribosomal protein L4 [Dehalococcoidia bacterium]|jgi:large subunit ribosomal protein L4|nr:50S ribosomal protein L4 [Dehalococcoidia bacterium]|tara:strand:+ start:83 stop:733 length:651 start_codon:yes stop_codon:yes gene_type:complete